MADQADHIAASPSYWSSFQQLATALGKTTYRAEIRAKLSLADAVDVPIAYDELWRTPVQGVLTVNLDNFVKRSFSNVFPGSDLKWFTGGQAGRLSHLLHSQHKFAYSLHGSIDDADSWVFTQAELKKLYRTPGYKQMLTSIFTGYTVLFLGISADDTAVGGPLESLASLGIQGHVHYWLTDRNDFATDAWAERNGVRLLTYAAGRHEIVKDVLADLASAVAREVVGTPVVLASTSTGVTALPSPDELVVRPLDELRRILNDHAAGLLQQPSGEKLFDEFMTEYDEAVHRAWYTTARGAKNRLFDYTLEEEIAKGAFGRVFRATDPAGHQVAVKVLLTEIRSDPELLRSFRRGVRAMRILEEQRVPGMVVYKEATEIPAFVSMEWIEGPNLTQAKEARLLDDWDTVLWAAYELVSTLKRAHDLSERVLHRDIRPANVMLKNGWSSSRGYHDWDLVLLDFDLSTFRGAREKSVLAEGSALGFLAPEQLDPTTRFSTRHAAVDCFGVGMTLLYLCSGKEPEAYFQRRSEFLSLVRAGMHQLPSSTWQSLPRRMERLIINSTRDRQPDRWDLAQILREIFRLRNAESLGSATDADLLCDEIAARCQALGGNYEWNDDLDAIESERAGGLKILMRGAPEEELVTLTASWAALGVEDRGNLARYLPERTQRAAGALRSGPWQQVAHRVERQSLELTAQLPARVADSRLSEAGASLSRALAALMFTDP